MAVFAAIESKNKPAADDIWRRACQRLNLKLDSVEVCKTSGDPHDFLAESLIEAKPEPTAVTDSIRGGWTSASNAQADSMCPGRHLAQRGIPEPEKSQDASFGTLVHEALAFTHDRGLAAKLPLDAREVFDACREIEKKVCQQYFGDESIVKVDRHERLWVQWPFPDAKFKHSGEPDVMHRAATRALILDYKVLAGDVAESSRNMQLRDLAVLAKLNHPLLQEIAVAIIQPFVTHTPELCVYGPAELERSALELRSRVESSHNPNAPRIAGEVQCKFCLAKTKCNEFALWSGSMLPVVAEPVQQALLFSTAMANWTPEQKGLACSILPMATKRLEEIKAFLKGSLSQDAGAIPGWRLKDGSNRETITDPQACFDRVAAMGGKLDVFLKECVSVEKGPLRAMVNKATSLKGKALDGAMEEVLKGITESKQSAPTLARVEE